MQKKCKLLNEVQKNYRVFATTAGHLVLLVSQLVGCERTYLLFELFLCDGRCQRRRDI